MTLKTKYIQLFSNLNANTIILTPNRRLSATLHKLFQQYQLEQHRTVWPTPNILPLGLYLEQHFTSTSSLSLLSTIQEQCLWEKILTESKESSFLLQITETAEIARSARNLLCAWRVDLSLPDFTETNEYIIFKKWITDFECIIKEQSLIDQAALPDYLAKQILEKKIILNSHLILLGFNEITPQLHYFLSSCKSANNTVTIFSDSLKTTKQENCFRIKFKTDEEEILHIARLCKNIYDKNPTANIGCVFPSLEKKRDRVFQLFSQIFADENKLHADQNCLPFNISAGKPLLHYSIIQLAIQLLSLYKKNISIDAMGYLLTSPFLGEAETEKFKRAHLDVMLRKENLRQIDLTQLSFIQNICPLFTKRLTDFLNAIPPLHQANSYSAWAKKFGELLTLWGFPGERSLNSHEYQVIEQFLNLLNELSSLNQIFNNINYTHALNTLKKMAAKQIFQFKTPETSIQILGLLEAASLPFNYLFVAEMHDLSWPSKPNPNPLIPKSLQRRLQMPHASADRELIYCENLTNLFKQSAEQIIFSFAEKKEELDLEPSPLIRDIPEISFEKLLNTPYQSVHEKIYQIKKLEKIIDNQASIIEPHEKILGGSDIFKRQALCPFKAFAESRLHAKPLEIPTLGLRAKDRGVLLHKALEQIWNQISDHQTLINLNNINLNNYISNSIEAAFKNSNILTTKKNHRYHQLEKQRLQQLIWNWLQIEKNRHPFKVIQREKIETIQFDKMSFSLRIDRIDELENGKKLIIDYKMGNNQTINDWFGERPLNPQLPLYTAIDPTHTIGIAFAQIHAGLPSFKGISQYSLDIKGIKLIDDWQKQIADWKNITHQLSHDFYHGQSAVDPKEPSVCHWCALKTFCRIEEIT